MDVTPMERPALRACGRGALTSVGAKHLMRSPYLQSVTTTSAVVVFAAPPEDGYRVQVETTGGDQVTTAAAEFAGEPARRAALSRRLQAYAPEETVEAADFYLQRVDLRGLEPGTLYCYRLLGPGGEQTEFAPLATASTPSSDSKVEFVVLGDTGTGNAAALAIAQRLSETPFEFMLFLGDIAYGEGRASELQGNFFEVYDEYLRVVPAYTAVGNHEYLTRGASFYFRDFVLPGNERYYSFDWGNVHIVVLDTNHIDRAQLSWLEKDLATQRSRWTIVGGHHPPFSTSRRGSFTPMRDRVVPLLVKHGVDLVLSGHEHHYERFLPQAGVHYVVAGGGGGRITTVAGGPRTQVSAEVHHYLALAADHEKLSLRAIDIEGDVIDRLELEARPRSDPGG